MKHFKKPQKVFLILSFLIFFNIVVFAIFVKVTIVNSKKQNLFHSNKKIRIAVFDPITEFFLNELSYGLDNIEINNVNSYINMNDRISFFKQNKLHTSDAIIVFDPKESIKKMFNIESQRFFDTSQNFFYNAVYDTEKYTTVEDFLNNGLSASSKNLKFFLVNLTYILKDLDQDNQSIYERNFFRLNQQITDIFKQSELMLAPYSEMAINVVLIGSQAKMFLNDINFFGAIDIPIHNDYKKNGIKYFNNLRNMIQSGDITCIINTSGMEYNDIYRLSKINNVKYIVYNIYYRYDIQNYQYFSTLLKKCLSKK